MRSQDSAVQEVRSLGGTVLFRYARLVNAFSARSTRAATEFGIMHAVSSVTEPALEETPVPPEPTPQAQPRGSPASI